MKWSILTFTLAASSLLASCASSPGSGSSFSSTTNSGWTWMGGANIAAQNGTYGIQGMAAPSNLPGARAQGATWIDTAGNFWLFGGGYDLSASEIGYFNDLWKYSGGQWTWIDGSTVIDQSGTYGTQGAPSSGNIPGARRAAIQWTDAAGSLWLFGGEGYDSAGTLGELNDLWRYSAGQWT